MIIDKVRLSKIKMVVLDVDGVMTDCRIFLDSDGEWKRFFSIRDGAGIKRIMKQGYKLAVITGSKTKDIQVRMKNLGIHYFYEGAEDKEPPFLDLQKQSGIRPEEMAYMGDDYFDIPLLKKVGFATTVPEAVDEVKDVVHYISKRPGGNGAVRELCDLIYYHGAYSGKDSQ